MIKKALLVVPTLSVGSLALATVGVNANTSDLSPESQITEDNVHEIVEEFGLDSDDVILDENFTEDDTFDDLTVGEFEEIVQEIEEQPDEINIEEDYTESNGLDDYIAPLNSGTVMLHHTISQYSYDVNFSVAGQYLGSSTWTGTGATVVDVTSSVPGWSNSVGSRSLNTTVTNNNTVRLTGDVNIEHYIGTDFGGIPTGSTDFSTVTTWNSSYIP